MTQQKLELLAKATLKIATMMTPEQAATVPQRLNSRVLSIMCGTGNGAWAASYHRMSEGCYLLSDDQLIAKWQTDYPKSYATGQLVNPANCLIAAEQAYRERQCL